MLHIASTFCRSRHYTLPAFAICLLLATLLVSCEDGAYDISADELPHTGLARFTITTPNNTEIERSWISPTQFSITETADQTDTIGEMKIKGRGNSTWILPKRPYTIQTSGPCRLMGMDSGNTWALLANYHDQTLLRNEVALYMSREMSMMDFTPDSRFANLVINGSYLGIYQVSEPPETCIAHNTDDILLEFDAKARYHDITFHTTRNAHPINIHYPEVNEGDDTWHEISQWIQTAEDALFAENYTDSIHGYRKYFDVTSLVEWYLINEIAKNSDAIFYTSCFMHAHKGGKIVMGPVWDFDMAFGNYKYENKKVINDPAGFYIKNAPWYQRLFQDPAFVDIVKRRFNDFFSRREMIYHHIDQMSSYLSQNITLENKLWGKLCDYSSSSTKVETEYTKQAEMLKSWIEQRMQWLKQSLDIL